MRKFQRNLFLYLMIVVVLSLIGTRFLNMMVPEQQQMEYMDVQAAIEAKQVKELTLQGEYLSGVLTDGKQFKVYYPMGQDQLTQLLEQVKANNIQFYAKAPENTSLLFELLPNLLMFILMIGLLYFMFANAQGGANKAMSFGKSRAKLFKQEGRRITFSDVAGLKEEKEELYEIVDFLKNPQKFAKFGARIPKGVLMVGEPGTGKTYISRAIAGEATVPFYNISGSDFVEMFVGVGASRVRDLFQTAKKDAPCLVFIDEIDAVGRRRGAGLGGGNDEREQTLNQLLVEMDGFGDHEGIIVIAATNRPDVLDPALTRPGRFDRQIYIGIPDVRERVDVLKVHTKNKPLGPDVNLEVIAKRTPGFTPANLENLMNEAAIIAARDGKEVIFMRHLEEATTKVYMGVEKKSKVITPKIKRLVSVHEAGHAVTGYFSKNADPVHMVTIIPRGGAGGTTWYLPDEDNLMYQTKEQMMTNLVTALGGRAAEKVILGEISTGASGDLKHVAKIAKSMIVKFAMSDNLPQMAFSEEENVFIANDIMTRRDYSEQTIAEIDREVSNIVDHAYNQALHLVELHRDKLEELAKALAEFETLDSDDFKLVMEHGYAALKEKREDLILNTPVMQATVA